MEEKVIFVESFLGRIDAFLATELEITRSSASKLIENGNVFINDRVATKSLKVKMGDRVTVNIPDPVSADILPEDIPLEIVFEDDDLLVVNKPKGMVVHPAPGNYNGTLVNALLFHCKDSLSGINGVLRPGIVHRIDKDTSGLLIVAKNDNAHNFLAEQIKEHSFTREYEAVVLGKFKEKIGDIELPIGRHPVKRKQMAVTYKNSKPAKTHYEVLAETEKLSHLRLKLYTGRTHQIRVHMSYLGHPLAGDVVYGNSKNSFKSLNGQCLHAKKIGFVHPTTKEYIEFESDLPDYFKSFLISQGF